MAECTIYDKLRYIAETKDLIKAAIEAQDVEVLESATFRQYAEYITEIRKVSSVNGMQGDVTITAEDLGALTAIPSEYITETELNEKGYLTAVPDVYITEDELSSQLADKVSQSGLNEAIEGVRNDIPTNVSELTNDSGYITLNEVPKQDLSGYALKSDIPDISVKQDKLTAGNGISITDNVISLDYEFDLFEVVQTLPTDNISDNKVYLVLDSNGNEGNTYLEYLYVDGKWEELGKFKVNVDLSGYATEQWVNEQGFLKEHQDISNLATKEELATKQDTISDLETIRSGAAKGATALQSVPSTYALKTDILSAKTDTRYTTFEVQNPILSGKTILLQNEVTDSRKYHTLGYEKTITTSVPVQKYINITRYGSTPNYRFNFDTNVDNNYVDFSEYDDGQSNMGGDIPLELDKINEVTNLFHYAVTYVERDSEGNITGGGETVIADVIYDPNTKLLSVPGTEFSFAQIQRSDTNTYLFGGGTDGTEYFENGRYYYNFEQNPLEEGASLVWHPYYNSNLYWEYSVTINGLFNEESDVTTNDKPHLLNDYIRYSNNVKAYILTDKNTTFKTINGEQITGNGNIEVAANVDLSEYATKEELNAKQDTLVSGTNIKTINGVTLLGEGNITIEGGGSGADLSDYYTKTETDALVNPKLEQVTLTQAEYDALETKEDNVLYVINDAEDFKFKTINGEQIIGEGNIEIEASANNVPTVQTTVQGTTNNYVYSSGKDDKYSVISDTSTSISYSADKASINTQQYYWGSQSKNGNDMWSINGATTSKAGLMTASDKSKLDGIDITTKQDTLVSGTNIKTINGISLLGEGNITISGEGGSDLSGYYTKAEIDEMIGGASETITQINNLVV